MPPVMCVGKTLSDIPRMSKRIWLKLFSNKLMQICKDVRKFQGSAILNSDNFFVISRKSCSCVHTYANGQRLNTT